MNKPTHATGGARPELVRAFEPGTISLSFQLLNQLSKYLREVNAQTQKGGRHE